MKMTSNEIWLLILRFSSQLPSWVHSLAQSESATLIDSKKLNIEYKILDASYIEFLDQQIELEARGPEWNEILKKRVSALRPFVGKTVVTAQLLFEDNSLTIKIDPEEKNIINIEENTNSRANQ